MAEPILSVRDLQKHYGAVRVTNHVSLDVSAGEIHAIIGPNGAGKTTLIHQIAGHLKSDGGTLLYAGHTITHLPMQARARLGLVRTFQITSIIGSLSVLDNVALAVQSITASPLGLWSNAYQDEDLNEPARSYLAQTGLSDRADRQAGHLSHGEKRALEIAMALALKPKLLLLDEPMAGMGHDEAVRLTSLLQHLKGQIAMILVEHDMDAVFSLADRVSVLVDGEIIACAAPALVRQDPRVRAAYLGDEDLPC
jgi:branched-chain amino acid transport system ATP-binding protein